MGPPRLEVDIDPRLAEEAVLLRVEALEDGAARRAFHAEREALYEVAEPEAREAAFARFYAAAFGRLDHAEPIRAALDERPLIAASVARSAVSGAVRAADEGAELYVRGGEERLPGREGRRLRIRLRPQTLLDPPALSPLLRRELLHTSDMLDPAFGYEPALPPSPAGQTHDRLLLDRYGAAWAASVAGRLVRAGLLDPVHGEAARRRFLGPFGGLGPDAERAFARWFEEDRPTHAALAAFALDPRAGTRGAPAGAGDPGSRCSLCAMPSYAFAGALEPALAARVRTDFPAWRAGDPVCPQCRDLYLAAEAARNT